MKPIVLPVLALVAGLSLATTACSKNDSTGGADATATDTAATDTATSAPAAAATPASHAAQFLSDAIQTNNAEIKFGQAAQSMGYTQAVRDFGKMLVDDHTKANGQATQLAQSMNVVVPTGVKPDDMAAYNMATSMSGAGFDKDFAADMVKGHQKAIDMFQKEADSSDPAPVTDFAKQTLPTLKKHLETAKSLQK